MDRRQFLAATFAGAIASPALASVPKATSPVYRFSHQMLKTSRGERAINRCYKLQPVKKTAGLYLELGVEDVVAHINQDLDEYFYADGPRSKPATREFRYCEFRCPRSSRYHAERHGGTEGAATATMKARGTKLYRFMLDRANWPDDRVMEYDGTLGCDVIASAVESIERATFGMIDARDLLLLWNAWTCQIPESAGIANLAIPDPQTGRGTRDAILLARPGGLIPQSLPQWPTFATVTAFFHEELAVWRSDDGREMVCESFVPKLTCPASGVYLKAT
jgi:hypothetical protein